MKDMTSFPYAIDKFWFFGGWNTLELVYHLVYLIYCSKVPRWALLLLLFPHLSEDVNFTLLSNLSDEYQFFLSWNSLFPFFLLSICSSHMECWRLDSSHRAIYFQFQFQGGAKEVAFIFRFWIWRYVQTPDRMWFQLHNWFTYCADLTY